MGRKNIFCLKLPWPAAHHPKMSLSINMLEISAWTNNNEGTHCVDYWANFSAEVIGCDVVASFGYW